MDVWQYFLQKEAEFKDLGLAPDGTWDEAFEAEEGSGGLRGRVWVLLTLTDSAYLRVYERIVIRGTRLTREAYAYSLVIDGVHVRGWHREPLHTDSPVHEHHGKDRTRKVGTRSIAFKRVVELCWEEISLRAGAPLGYDA